MAVQVLVFEAIACNDDEAIHDICISYKYCCYSMLKLLAVALISVCSSPSRKGCVIRFTLFNSMVLSPSLISSVV